MMQHFDVTIIGNGISASAILHAFNIQADGQQPLRIALVCPDKVESKTYKVGESIPSTVSPILKKLNLWEAFKALNFPYCETRYTSWENDQLIPSRTQHGSWCIDRIKFEEMLWNIAQTGTFTQFNAVFKQSEKSNWGWLLYLSNGETINSRFVVDCSGRAASFAKRQVQRQRESNMNAMCDFLTPLNNEVTRTPGVMIEAVSTGWWYSNLLPNKALTVAYFTSRDLIKDTSNNVPQRWEDVMQQSQYTKLRIETGEFKEIENPTIHDSSMLSLKNTTGENWLACGDAAMAVDPIGSHGIAISLWSALKGAHAVSNALQGNLTLFRQYNESCQSNWRLYCEQRAHIYSLHTKYKNFPFWESLTLQ